MSQGLRFFFLNTMEGSYLPVSTPFQFSREVVKAFAKREVLPHPDTPWTMKGWKGWITQCKIQNEVEQSVEINK